MQQKWRTSITSAYKRRCVLRASFVGGFGVACLVAGGSFMPLEWLSIWGLPLLVGAGGLITWSMLPYRRTTRLENKPDELWLNASGSLTYAKGGSPTLTVPEIAVEKMFYIAKPNIYGICIAIKPHPPEKVRVHDVDFNYSQFQQDNIRKYGCEIFLSFFSERTFNDISTPAEPQE